MKITGKRSITWFLKIAVDLVLVINIIVLIALPFILNAIYNSPALQPGQSGERVSTLWLINEIPDESYAFMLIFLYFSGICTAFMLFSLHRVLRNLADGRILDHANASALKHLSVACGSLVSAFIVKIIFYNTFLTIFCFFIFIVLALFSLILSEVFRQGAVVKEENELTI